MEDKGRLLKDLLRLGVCFRTRLTENDLSVYADMIDRQLDDREWAYAFDYFTGAWKDEPPKFMPTPQEMIEAGRLCQKPPPPLTEEQMDFRRRYFEAAQRRRKLLAEGDDLLHQGEAQDAK